MSHPPIRFLDRAKETTTTTGSGSIALGGAVAGFVAISGIGNGNSTYYTITENNDFEIGIGTYNSAGNTLSRSEVFSSSNSDNSKINLGGGATVFITYSADKVVSRTSGNYVGIGVDPEYQLQVAGTGSFNTVRWADGTVQTTAATGGTSYTAGTGLNLVGTTFNVSGSTTSVQGIVQLEDGLSTSTTKAITPNAVNTTSGNLQSSIDTNTSNITTNTSNISTNTSNIASNVTNIAATGAKNAADLLTVSGVTDTNATNIATNTSNISTNTSNISTNTSNISTNTSNIATNVTNIAATGAKNAADLLTVSGVTDTNASNISTNTSNISTNTSNISTNTSNISTNTSNIATNVTNIAATGAKNAADLLTVSGVTDTNASNISTNTSNISTNTSNISTNTSNISTNTSNIATNVTNIAATGAKNAADLLTVSGVTDTNASNISTNTSNISTNTTNIAATGAKNAADLLTVSGIAVAHTTPGGDDTQVQFNDGGSFAGDSDFTWNKTSNTLTIAGYALPNTDASLSGYVLTSNADGTTKWAEASGGGGGGGGAPTSAEYVTLALSPGLSDERVLAVGTGLQITDGGANNNVTIDTFVSSTSVTGIVQLQDSATDGTVDKAITPNAVYDVSGVLQGKVDTNTSNISTNTSNIATNVTNIAATGAKNAADLLTVSGVTDTNATNISTNTANIATNVTNIAATGAKNAADLLTVSGVTDTNATNISTNTSNISTNTSNISTNTSNISTNTSNIASNVTNIAATGAKNAADLLTVSGVTDTNASNISTNTSNISTNTTNIATNVTNIAATGAKNAADLLTVSGVTDTNATNISTNTSNISTNVTNIAATGAKNAADLLTVSGVTDTNASNISTNTSNISTNTTNIATNVTNIAATGAKNAADLLTVSGVTDTNASNISTNTSNISTNTTNIAATGAKNAADILIVSGLTGSSAAGSDTYVQFNDGGSFGGESEFTYSKAGSGILKVGTIVTNDADAGRIGVVSIGSGALVSDHGGVAIGREAKAPANSVAIGRDADAGSLDTVAIGYSTYTYGTHSTAIGYNCQTNGSYSAAIGHTAVAESRAYAIGKSITSQRHGIGIGNFVNVPESGFVIGNCESTPNAILSGQFNDTSAATNGYLLTSTKFGINRTSKPDAMLDVTSFANTDVGVIVQGAASQTADLQQWQNSAGTTLASIAPGLNTTDRMTLMVSGTIVSNPSDADRIGVVSIGSGAYSTADHSVVIGRNAIAAGTSEQITIVGDRAEAYGYSVAVGAMSNAKTHSHATALGYYAYANAARATAVGANAAAVEESTALGKSATASANYSIAIGHSAQATDIFSCAIGKETQATQPYTIALGYNSYATAKGGIVIGSRLTVGVESGFIVGQRTVPTNAPVTILSGQFNSSFTARDGYLNILEDRLSVSGDGSVKVNNEYTFPTGVTPTNDYVLTAQTDGSTAWAAAAGGSAAGSDTYVQFNDGGSSFGGESEFTYTKAGSGILKVGTIVTNDADAGRIGAVSIGSGAYNTQDGGVAIGATATNQSARGVAIGYGTSTYSTSDHSRAGIAIGNGANTTNIRSIAMGYNTTADSEAVAIGGETSVANKSVGLGWDADAASNYAVSIGYKTNANGLGSIAIGGEDTYGTSALGVGAIALGYAANASDDYSLAIGHSANAPISGLVVTAGAGNSILSGQFNDTAAATNGYLLTSTRFGINRTSTPDAMLDVTSFANTDVGVIVQGAASQSADLQQWQNSAGTTLASIAPSLNTTDRMTMMISGSIVSNPSDADRIGVVSIGSGAYSMTDNNVVIGTNATVGSPGAYGGAVSIGLNAHAMSWGIAIGNAASAISDQPHMPSIAIGTSATTNGKKRALAIGQSASAGNTSVALGSNAYAGDTSHSNCVAIGYLCQSVTLGSTVIGCEVKNHGDYNTVIGYNITVPSTVTSGLIIGHGAANHILSGQFNDTFDAVNGHLNILGDSLKVSGNGQVRVNDAYTLPTAVAGGSDYVLTAQTDGSTAWAAAAAGGSPGGSDTYVQFNDGGSAFGGESRMTYDKTGSGTLMLNGKVIACPSDANLIQSMSIGSGAEAFGDYSVAIGPLAQGDAGGSATAVGRQALAGSNSVALGNGANASAAGATALGLGTTAAAQAVAIGYQTTATTTRSVAIGDSTNSTHLYSIGVGYECDSHGDYGVAVGAAASAGSRSVGLGLHADASADYSIAMGNYQIAPQSGFVIGQGAGNSILSGQFNDTAAATNGYLLTSTKFGINRTSKPDAMLDVTNFANTDVGVIVQGAASQTADLQQWQDSAGTTLASIAPGLNTTDRMTLMVSGTIVSNLLDADKIGTVSIGSGTYAGRDNSVAIGRGCSAGSTYSVAIGDGAKTALDNGMFAVSIGTNTSAYTEGIAMGYGAATLGNTAISMGVSARVSHEGIGIGEQVGWNAGAPIYHGVAIGHRSCNSLSSNNYVTAVGYEGEAGDYGTAIGAYAEAGTYGVSLGYYAMAPTSGLVLGAGRNNHILSGQFNDTFDAVNGHLNILGDSLKISGNGQVRVNDAYTLPTAVAGGSDYVLTAQTDGSTAWAAAAGGSAAGSDTYVQFNDGGSSFGGESEFTYSKAGSGILKVGTIIADVSDAASYPENVAVGSGARASDTQSVAVGGITTATGPYSTAVGYNADAASYGSVGIGQNSKADGTASVAVGHGADAGGNQSVALGYLNSAAGQRSIVIGDSSNDNSNSYGVAIGYTAKSNGSNSVAVGRSAQASAYSVALGNNAIAPTSGLVIGAAGDNSILSGQFNDTSAATNGYLLTSTKFGINRTSKPDAMLDVTSFANTDVGVIVQGAASQTADLQQWQNSAGTTVASISPNSDPNGGAVLLISGTIVSSPADIDQIGVVSIGSGCYVSGDYNVAIGSNNYLKQTYPGSSIENKYNILIGNDNYITEHDGPGNVYIGNGITGGTSPNASDYGVGIGWQNRVGTASVAIGKSANNQAGAINSVVAIGGNANGYDEGATAVGSDARSRGLQSTCLGFKAGESTDLLGSAPTSNYSTALGSWAVAGSYGVSIGYKVVAPTSGLVVGGGFNNHILSGQFNDTFDAVNGHLNILGDSLKVSGNGQVRVNDAYTLPTAVAGGSDYVLTAQTDGSTAWAAAAGGGSPGGSDTYVQFNDGGSFGGESRMTYDKTGSGTLMLNGTMVAHPADVGRFGVVSVGSGARVTSSYGISIGRDAESAGGTAVGNMAHAVSQATALGDQASTEGGSNNPIAIGYNADAKNSRALTIGSNARSESEAIAIGHTSVAEGNATVIGDQAQGNGTHDTVVGHSAKSDGSHGIALGYGSHTMGDRGISIGWFARAPKSGLVIGAGYVDDNYILSGQFNDTAAATNGHLLTSTKFGINRTSKPEAMLDVTNHANTDVGVIVQGAASQTADLQQWQNSAGTTLASIAPSLNTTDRMTMMVSGTIVSNPSDADRIGVVSIGSGAYSTTNNNVVIGANATAGAGGYGEAVSIGRGSHSMSWGIAIGAGASATSSQPHMPSIAIGYAATANGQRRALAIGANASAGNRCISIGNDSDAGDSSHGSTVAVGYGCRSVTLGSTAVGTEVVNAGDYNTVLGYNFTVDSTVQSGLIIGRGANNHILSGQFNDTFDAVNGHLNILGDSLKVSGNGQVRVNDAYTLPTAVAGGSDYVLTAQTDGSTAWAAAAAGGGSAAGASNYIQYNNGGAFDADGNFTWNSGTQVLTVSGHIAATTKSFLIDHPTKPEKQLQYACLEGPENGVYVRGHTNDRIIDLPDYWTGLVDEDSITVQITAKDAPQPYLYVSGVTNNQVHLISDRSVSAYYTINGTRKDVAPLQVEI